MCKILSVRQLLIVSGDKRVSIYSWAGILWDKPLEDKFRNIPNDDKQTYHCCRLKSLVEKFRHCYFEPTNQK